MMAALLGLGAVALLALRINLVLVLMAVTMAIHMVYGAGDLSFFLQDLWAAMDREVILAVPLFVLVGSVMARGSIAGRLIDIMVALSRPIPGGLAVATILSCAVFSALSGSSIVTMLAIGSILYPALLREGYSERFSVGALCAGGTLGIVIPPSIPMVLFSVLTESNLTHLFLAGIGPGILLTALFTTYAVGVNWHIPRQRFSLRDLAIAGARGLPALGMPVLLLGGIYSGYFTPTEAAAVALTYALVIELVMFRDLTLADYRTALVDSARLIGTLFPLIAVAASLNLVLTEHRVPHHVIAFLAEQIQDQDGFLLLANLTLLVMGCFMDTASALTVSTPLLVPLAETYGLGRIHLGILMILNLEIGMLTPPFGMNLIVAATTFRLGFWFVCKAALPFVAIMLACLVLIALNPWIALGLGQGG